MLRQTLFNEEMTNEEWREIVLYDNWGRPDWPGGCRCDYCVAHPDDSYYKKPVTRESQLQGLEAKL